MRLRIKRWPECFEAAKSQRPKGPMTWMALPVREEGLGWRKLSVKEEDDMGAKYYGLWVHICKCSADLDEPLRGQVLRADGTPYTTEMLYERFGLASLETWKEAVAFFLSPAVGWLIDEDAQQATAQPSKVVAMPMPKIEEPSIYEAAAVRMLDRYANAGAPVDRMPDPVAVANAIWRKCGERANDDHESLIDLMEDNQRAYIASQAPKMLKTLDAWIAGGLSLATRKGPKQYERGSVEALILTEVRAGRMTEQQAKEQGVQL